MPKFNVTEVDLYAVQEIAEQLTALPDDFLYWERPPFKLGKPIKISTVAATISELLGSGSVIPDRAYTIGSLPSGASVEIDSDPLSPNFGLPILIDPYLDGLDYSIWARGVEYFEKGVQWQNDVPGGGFSLKEVGAAFQDGQKYFLVFKPQFSSVIVSPDAIGKSVSGEAIVTGDTAADDSLNRLLILIQGSAVPPVNFTLNPTYPENVTCIIKTGGGDNYQSIIKPPIGQFLTDGGTGLGRVVLGQSDFLKVIRIGSRWRIIDRGERWKYVGLVRFGGIPGPDTISGNGQTLVEANYPSLADYLTALETALPGSVLSMSAWGTNKTQWGRGGGNIGVPLLNGMFPRFLDLGAGNDPERGASGLILNSVQLQSLQQHNHTNGLATMLVQPSNPALGSDTYATFGPSGASSGRNSNWIKAGPTGLLMLASGGLETRPKNVGLPAIITI